MAKLKLAAGVEPIRKEHCGCTFQHSRIGQTIMSSQKNDRTRNTKQNSRKQNATHATTHWRNLSAAEKLNWSNFAATYPVPTKANPAKFLSGYQLFIKRQSYLFLNDDSLAQFMTAPTPGNLTLGEYNVTIDQTENCIDVTMPYIKNFGIIPMPGQFMLIKILPYSVTSGQFFPIITQTIEILESYIDGLFVSLHFLGDFKNIIFSVYLSKPFNQSVTYTGTKTRYMGCFTSKTFLQLTDTPDSYVGQAGKKVVVKANETGLEFIPDTAGGLTCETLTTCPKIISIDQAILTLQNMAFNSGQSSLPPLNYGLLYNKYAYMDVRNLLPVGWIIPSYPEIEALKTYLGGGAVTGGKIKETNFAFWNSPNTGATNETKFNMRGAGYRVGSGGYTSFKLGARMPSSYDLGYGQYGWNVAGNTSADGFSGITLGYKDGVSVRPRKSSTTLSNGQSGTMTGNNGIIYRTICINGIEWLADNLAETKFRTGEDVPLVTDNAAWAALVTAGYCYPNGSASNV